MNSFTDWDSELYHHGIKGQKWGIRNYQNLDGTLTPAGRERYGKNARLVENKAKQARAVGNTFKKVTNILTGVSAGLGVGAQVGSGIAAAIGYGTALAAAPYAAAAAAVAGGAYLGSKIRNWIADKVVDVYMTNVDQQYASSGESYVNSKWYH